MCYYLFMATLVFDIETVGEDFDSLDEATQSVLTRWIEKSSQSEEEYKIALEDVKNGLGFSPLTGSICAIGVFDVEKEKGAVYFQAPGQKAVDIEENGVKLKSMTEKEMLESFWKGAENYDTFVTFNGRSFDAPFLALRSAAHNIRPSKDLLSNRYLSLQRAGAKHVDLLDQLTFYGAMWKKPSLHLVCRAFGIESPKASGTTGDDVAGLFKAKKFIDIARYNVGDLRATSALYEKWKKYLA